MLHSYLTSILRYISRNKGFTFINIAGLVIGMTACLLIVQYVLHEFSYDRFLPNHDRAYRVQLDRYNNGEVTTRWAAGCLGIGPDLKAEFPEVQQYVRMTRSDALLSNGDTFFKEDNVYYTSAGFFEVFGIHLLQGNDTAALQKPHTMVLSRSLAKKYFADQDPVGRTLRNNGSVEYLITGTFEDLPATSHMRIDALLSFATYAVLVGRSTEAELNEWQWDGFLTYVLLNEGANAPALESKLPAYVERREGEELKRWDAGMVFHLKPITDIHLGSDLIGEFKPNGSRETAYYLLVIAILILVIAWINYVNLATARSIERAREVGVRKVMGSFRGQLVQQFLLESGLMNMLAMTLSIGLVALLTPSFERLAGREIGYLIFNRGEFWLSMIILALTGTLVSGLYPAFVLSSFRPVDVLKGRFKNTAQGLLFRKGMVIVQFIASITLFAGTFAVYEQINYMRSQDIGVNVEQTAVIRTPNITDSTYQQKYKVLKDRMMQYPEVVSVSASSSIPGGSPDWNAGGIRRLSQREEEANQYRVIMMDDAFIPAYGLQVIAGRGFSSEVAGDERTVMLNESGSRLMGFAGPAAAINDMINFWGDTFRIVGVVKDYGQESPKKSFEPLVFRYSPAPEGFYSVRLNTIRIRESMAQFEGLWKELFPGNPFDFFFLDDHYNRQYQADVQFGKVFGLFSALAIFIASLGLYGLSSLAAIQRTREIGIRKVLGATVPQVLLLVNRGYVGLLLVAAIVAFPLAWWILDEWLQEFANRIELSWWIFVIPGIVVMTIALLTVNVHSLRAAQVNPARSLQYE